MDIEMLQLQTKMYFEIYEMACIDTSYVNDIIKLLIS